MRQSSLLNFGTVIFYPSSVKEITYYSLPSSELLRFLVQNSVQKQSVLYHPGFKADGGIQSLRRRGGGGGGGGGGRWAGAASMNFSLVMVGLSLALE